MGGPKSIYTVGGRTITMNRQVDRQKISFAIPATKTPNKMTEHVLSGCDHLYLLRVKRYPGFYRVTGILR